jgi:hypothetical protein
MYQEIVEQSFASDTCKEVVLYVCSLPEEDSNGDQFFAVFCFIRRGLSSCDFFLLFFRVLAHPEKLNDTLKMHVLKGLLLQIQLHTWLFCCTVTAFQPQRLPQHHKPSALSLKIFDGFLENLDDAIDDFMNKRMGTSYHLLASLLLNLPGQY